MATQTFGAAAIQLCSTERIDANLSTCRDLAAKAAAAGARLIVLPENFGFLGLHERDKLAVAESLDTPGPILGAALDIARSHGVWVVAGGFPERIVGDADRTYNTCVAISPAGEVVATYRKIHLFDIDIPGRAQLRESSTTAPGTDVVAATTELATIGLSVCYDLRFPELYRDLVLARGAHVVVVPAAFTAHTGAAHWHTLLRCRAIENQCYVIAAAQYGRHNDKRHSYGHSLIVDPWGTLVAELPDGDGFAAAELDLAVVARTREQMPCLSHQVLLR